MSYYVGTWKSPKNTMHAGIEIYDSRTAPLIRGLPICFDHHNHEELEILSVIRGRIRLQVEDQTFLLSQGDVFLINPFRIHYAEWDFGDDVSQYYCLTVNLSRWLMYSESVLSGHMHSLLGEKSRFDALYPAGSLHADSIMTCLHGIHAHFQDKSPTGECLTASRIYELLAILFDGHYARDMEEPSRRRNVDFMQNVTRYLTENYAEDISTRDIADALFMSMPRFCHIFRQHFGMNFSNYLCRFRVIRAAELYKGTQMPLSEVAAAVGFLDYCYFSRVFKKYIGCAPAVYFGRRKSTHPDKTR